MSTPAPTTPDAREQARLEREASQTRNEHRASNAERFGFPHEQDADREANIASLPPEVQARIRAEDAARFYAVRIVGSAVLLPVRAVFFDNHTQRLTIGVDLPAGYGPTHDKEATPYRAEADPAALAAKIDDGFNQIEATRKLFIDKADAAHAFLSPRKPKLPDEEPHTIIGQGSTARHLHD